jgi:hypothetical protein
MDRAWTVLTTIAGAAMIGAASSASAKTTSVPSSPPPANLCDTPGHHQFDFWVGRWDVYRPDTGQLVAHSNIEKLYAGCAVRENWMPLKGAGGGSLNSYRPSLGRWVQIWTDSGNNLNQYSGAWSGKRMDLAGTSTTTLGKKVPVRMTYERLSDGSVVQTGYQKDRTGKRWVLNYTFVYRRAADQR